MRKNENAGILDAVGRAPQGANINKNIPREKHKAASGILSAALNEFRHGELAGRAEWSMRSARPMFLQGGFVAVDLFHVLVRIVGWSEAILFV